MTPSDYPKRPQFFANKFIRKLTKAVVANELGPEVCWLLTVIAMQEDTCGYRKPISFHNAQLMLVCGIVSVKQFLTIRTKATRSGWLTYLAGKRCTPAYYWVKIPEQFDTLDDGPTCEAEAGYDDTTANGAAEPGINRASIGHQSGINRGSDRASDGQTFFPIPNPIPIPNTFPDPAKPGRGKPKKPPGEKPPRPRNPLFDALAEVSGLDPATAGPRIGTAAALLAKAQPPYSPDEVREFGRRFWQLCPWAAEKRRPRPTPGEVANHIGLLRADPTTPHAGAGRVDQRTDYAKRTLLDALGIDDTPEDAPCPTRPPAATRPALPSVPPPPG